EVVQFSDAARGTYKKLVIRDGRLVGAILLGDCTTAGTVVQLFDRGGPVPSDPLSLLFSGLDAPTSAASPALMPAIATVCRCNNVTKGDIQACWLGGANSVTAVAEATRATTGCGTCRDAVAGIVGWLAETATTAREEVTA
ncbi:MAG TPA: (2Fe-2S)-binding protein, partial [Mycobacteriales bacterium]|nr:(2Fe-2S)-binding protein [Mycobacteriales bacterium]